MSSCPYGSPVCNGNDDLCFDCADNAHAELHPEPVDGCRQCKYATIQVHGQVGALTRTRRHMAPGVPKGGNEWERGIVKDDRGVPLIVDGDVIGVKQYAERRSELEAKRRLLHRSEQ